MREYEKIFHDDVSARAQGIYTYLRYRQGKNNGCFPTHKTIARENKCSVSTEKRVIKELVEKCYIDKINRRLANGSRTSNLYICK